MGGGQIPVAMIVGFVLFILALGLIAIVFYETSSPTGQVVLEEEKANFLNYPFELRAWVINPEGIGLDIKNNGKSDYLIQSIEIEGCGRIDVGKAVIAGESKIFEVKCSLTEGTEFDGGIVVRYSSEGEEGFTAEGNVADSV